MSDPIALPPSGRPRLHFILLASGDPAGDERWLVEAAAALCGRGHTVRVAAPSGSAVLARSGDAGVPASALPLRSRWDPRAFIGLRALLRRPCPDAVLALDATALRQALRAARWTRAPAIYLHQGGADLSRVAPLLDDPRVQGVLAPEGGGRGAASGWRIGDSVALVDGPQPPDRMALRRELRLPRRVALVMHAGDLVPGAGQATSLAALGILAARRAEDPARLPVPTVAFVGTGPEESRLHVAAHDLRVNEHVLWVGYQKDARRHLAAGDVLVVPSAQRGSRWTVLDAMAVGSPIIAADPGAGTDLVQHEVTGLQIPPDDPPALAAALEVVLRDPERAALRAAAARRFVATHASAPALGAELECLVFATRLAHLAGAARPALFVDRDGTLVRNVPYNPDPAAVELEPNAARALRWIRRAGFAIVVVSNQSAVARGLSDVAAVHAVNDRLRELLRRHGVEIDAIEFCPHHPDYGPACECRKPAPGMLLRAARAAGLDLARSFTVGDAARDLEAGQRAGTATLAYAGPSAAGAALDFPDGTRVAHDWMDLASELLRAAWVRSAGADGRS